MPKCRPRFERSERALVDTNLAVLDDFGNSPHTVRYAPRGNSYGFDAFHADRLAAVPASGCSEPVRVCLRILTLGTDLARVNLEHVLRRQSWIGRQGRTRVRLPGLG